MLIRVSDNYEVRLQPERGTVSLRVLVEGADKTAVTEQATEVLERLTARVREILNPGRGPVTAFNQGQLQNSAHHPWNQDGRQLPWVYQTSATMTARFSDFGALFGFIEDVATWPGVEVHGVKWELTCRTEELALADAQAEAVRRVTEKALRLATAAGATEMVPTILADPGLLHATGGAGVSPTSRESLGRMPMAAFATADARAGSGLSFQPEDIVLVAAIEAEFEAS